MHWLLEGLSLCAGLFGLALVIFIWSAFAYYLSILLKILTDLLIHSLVRWIIPHILSMHLLLSGQITAYLLHSMRAV